MAIVVAFPIPTGTEIELAKLGEVRVWREDADAKGHSDRVAKGRGFAHDAH